MKKLTLQRVYQLILYLAIAAGLVDTVWARIFDNVSIGTNPVFQTTLLFVILLHVVKLHYQSFKA